MSKKSGVSFQQYPPTTGSQKCDNCGEWIIGSISFYLDKRHLCPFCYKLYQKNHDGEVRYGDRI